MTEVSAGFLPFWCFTTVGSGELNICRTDLETSGGTESGKVKGLV